MEIEIVLKVLKVLLPASIAFFIGILITPTITNFLYKHKMWKKKSGKIAYDGKEAAVFNSLHQSETKTPRLGGMVIWLSVLFVSAIFWFLPRIFDIEIFWDLEFISRNQTWIPLATLFFGALVGLIDDLYEIKGDESRKMGGMSAKKRLAIVGIVALLVSLWFYIKLGITAINLPFGYELYLGWLIIPFFILVTIAIYSGGVIDGIDGLAGGVFASIFSAYSVISFSQGQIDLAVFCALVVGAILAFLWFNVPPARFYMSETGSMSLTLTLSVVAFMTDKTGDGLGFFVLPIVAFLLLATAFSSFIQIMSKKFFGKKIFLSAPIHHHFEALGWPSYKVTMRYWILSIILAALGSIIALAF